MFGFTLTIASLIIFIISYSILYKFYYKKKILDKLITESKKSTGNKIVVARMLIKNNSINRVSGIKNKVEDKLSLSGLEIDINYFISMVLIISLVLFCLTLLATSNFIFSITSIGLLIVATNIMLSMLIKARIKKVSDQLLDMVVNLSSSLKSGYSLIQGLNTIVLSGSKPLSSEVELVLRDINIGQPYEEAFEKMIKRNPIEDLEILITGILINKETGGNLSHILDGISETIRERMRMQGEVRSLTAQGRLSGMILSLMPICIGILVYAINPSYISPIFQHPIGRVMLIFAACSEIIGIIIIKKIVDIDW